MALTLPGSGPTLSEDILCPRKIFSAAHQCLIRCKLEVEWCWLFEEPSQVAHMLFPVLGEANDTVDEQFHSFEAFANSQHDGMEPTRGRNKSS